MNWNVMTLRLTFYNTHLSPLIFDLERALRSCGGDEGVGRDSVNGLVGP